MIWFLTCSIQLSLCCEGSVEVSRKSPVASWLCAMLYCFGSYILADIMLGGSPVDYFQHNSHILLASAIWWGKLTFLSFNNFTFEQQSHQISMWKHCHCCSLIFLSKEHPAIHFLDYTAFRVQGCRSWIPSEPIIKGEHTVTDNLSHSHSQSTPLLIGNWIHSSSTVVRPVTYHTVSDLAGNMFYQKHSSLAKVQQSKKKKKRTPPQNKTPYKNVIVLDWPCLNNHFWHKKYFSGAWTATPGVLIR